MTFTALIAEEPAPAQPVGKAQEQPFYQQLPFMLAIFGLFFLVVMLPAQRRQKREKLKMMDSMKPGSKVILASGIVGTLIKLKDDGVEAIIRTEDTKLCVLRSAITTVVAPETADVKS